jgi:3-phenylpropionate/trans-cinnamate dioxygenase ferredoxin reductase subunit
LARFENVIVGGGLAGGMVAQEYREQGGDGSTLIVCHEQHTPYHRPPLTKEFLRGEKQVEELAMQPVEWWREHEVELRLGDDVTAVDVAGHAIEVGGERIEFGRLALATGSTPRPLEGAETIRTIEDSQAVGALLERGSGHLAVLGGGFIGVEAAASARMKGLEVTLAMQNEVIWDHLFGAEVGRYFQRHMEDHGVRILSGRDGLPDDLDADMVVAGIGVTPNVDLARDAGLEVNTGVLTDDHLQAAPDVWAVGDIAEYQSVIHGRRIRIEHWDVALNHGAYVGRLWAGKQDGPYDVVPYFFSDLADWTWMEYIGPGSANDAVDVRGSMADDDFVAYYTDADGKLTACLAVNRSDELNEAKELLVNGAGAPG